jgi:hypothetical protein
MATDEDVFDTAADEQVDAIRYFVEKKIASLQYLVSQEADKNVKNDEWYHNLAVERSTLGARSIDLTKTDRKTSPLSVVKVEGLLDTFENYIRLVEKTIFYGPLAVANIKTDLEGVVFTEKVNATQKKDMEMFRDSPWCEAAIRALNKAGLTKMANDLTTGQPSSSNMVSLPERKNRLQAFVDEISETLTVMKTLLTAMEKTLSGNDRTTPLRDRYEKCEQEIGTIRDVIRSF